MTLSTRNSRGFTLAELLITVAIIGVLVAISIPVFASQTEKSREATDLSNVRAAYTEVMAEAITENMEYQEKTVPLKQKQDDWQSADSVTIGGITHAKGEGDTDHWKGIPGAEHALFPSIRREGSGSTGKAAAEVETEADRRLISMRISMELLERPDCWHSIRHPCLKWIPRVRILSWFRRWRSGWERTAC